MTDLGTLGGTYSVATGINNSGQIVGYADTASGQTHAFLYSGGTMTDLGTLPGGTYSFATGINNNGQIVGYSTTASGQTHAFLYSGGQMTDLGTLPGGTNSWATGINDRRSNRWIFANSTLSRLMPFYTILHLIPSPASCPSCWALINANHFPR